MSRTAKFVTITLAVTLAAVAGILFIGSVDIPPRQVLACLTGGEAERATWRMIVVETRLPAALTALLAGSALGVAGLLLQTTFDNPLAGPSILGISTGASLGVAIVMLAAGGALAVWGPAATVGGALAGALAVLAVLLAMAAAVRSATMLLIVGILVGYLASSAIALLNFFSVREGISNFAIWGLGNFGGVTLEQMKIFAPLVLLSAVLSLLFVKPLNALLLGVRYAESSGVNVRAVRAALLLLSGLLTAVVTAWCGPIGFIGLIVPHMARLGLRSSDHRRLLPVTALCGAATGAVCMLLCVLPASRGVLPINAVTPVVGVPIIIYIIVRRRSIFYFN